MAIYFVSPDCCHRLVTVLISLLLCSVVYSKKSVADIQGVCDVTRGCPETNDERDVKELELEETLQQVVKVHLTNPLTEDEKKKPELVHSITQSIILPGLQLYHSEIAHMGSSFEFTAVPGKSDYDIQFFIKLNTKKSKGKKKYSAVAETCHNPAWRRVKGGPEYLLDENGYLSTDKARRLVQSEIDKYLNNKKGEIVFAGHQAKIKRSTSGPAITLNVNWKKIQLSIDVVVCLRAGDVGDSEGHDLVGKPYKGEKEGNTDEFWRLSYSRQELLLLTNYRKHDSGKNLLLRIMKVLKEYQVQLRYLPSYFYKNVLFKLCEKHPNARWDLDSLPARFKDMIKLMSEILESKTLYLHFNKQVNYLADKDSHKLNGISNYLKSVINKNKYADLLKTVPLK